MRGRRSLAALAAAAMLALGGQAARAESLADTMVAAYRHSALIEQNRAVLRAADEDVAAAIAALRPVVQWTASHTVQRAEGLTGYTTARSTSLQIGAQMLLYDWGRSQLAIDSAKEQVLAARQGLVAVEQDILLAATVAFFDIRQATERVALQQNSVEVLTRERQAAQARLSQMQADLVQANKLATMGQITAGVAHEINQPLATIRLLSENGQAMQPHGPVADNLARITRMADRIGQITDQLRGFARKATGQVGAVPLRPVIQASLMLTASRRKAGDIPVHLPDIPDGLAVIGEQVRVEQILVNLLTNAFEAQEGCPDPWIRIGVQADDARVTLTVADNGPGLPPQVRGQLFAPFATSKAQGLGLGLVISRDIARDFGGDLSAADPVPGQGATFHLTLRKAA